MFEKQANNIGLTVHSGGVEIGKADKFTKNQSPPEERREI